MNEVINSMFSDIAGVWWMFYVFLMFGVIGMAGAIINFRKQLDLAHLKEIVDPEFREKVESTEVTPPSYWLNAVICCVISCGAIYAAIAMKFPNL